MPDAKTERAPGNTIRGTTMACRETDRGVDQGVILPDGEIRWFPGFKLGPFCDGRSTIIEKGNPHFGFIDRNGDQVIPFIYSNPIVDPDVHDEDDRLSEGLIRVRLEERTGYIGRNGAMVIEPVFEWGGRFSHGCAWATLRGVHGFIDRENRGVWGRRTALHALR